MTIIEPLEARIAPAVFVVTSTANSGPGTLRQAILDANVDPVADTINFNFPGNGGTIALANSLPIIENPVTINGYSEAGATVNTAEVGTNANILVEINGSDVPLSADGLIIAGSNVTIRGLAIYDFNRANSAGGTGIVIQNGSSNVVIEGCFIGVNASGGGDPLQSGGIDMGTNVANVRIGGPDLADRNVISNTGGSGIHLRGTDHVVQGNLIGTALDGVSPNPNSGAGVSMNFADGLQIGGPNFGEGNVIAFNVGDGIQISDTATGVEIRGNSIFKNLQLGIDLGSDGVTPNDAFDVDAGANNGQNFPVITKVEVVNGSLTNVFYSLDTTPNTPVRIDVYGSLDPDSSGYGEGQFYIGSIMNLVSDGNGHVEGMEPFLDTFALGTTLSATATNTVSGDTSEFSKGFNINAVELLNDKTATWVDGDGDRVTMKITKGTLTPEMFYFGAGGIPGGSILRMLQMEGSTFDKTNVTVSVKKVPGGDGKVAIGYLNATGVDLGNVSVPGDLARISCGDSDGLTMSLGKLKAQSFGVASSRTLPDAVAQSSIRGAVGSIAIAGDMRETSFSVFAVGNDPDDLARTHVGSFFVGGDAVAGAGSGILSINGSAKTITLKGSLISTNLGSASILVTGNVAKVTVGSLFYSEVGAGYGGNATAGHGKLIVKGNVIDGRVSVGIAMDSVTVGGSVIGTRSSSGTITTSDLALVSIRGDLVGGVSTGIGFVSNAGVIRSSGSIEKVVIGGSVIGGTTSFGAEARDCGAILVGKALGSVFIGGDTIGSADSPVVISAAGQAQKPASGLDLAIRSVTIKGNATNTQILGGFTINGTSANADASIGKVVVGKNWVGSSIAAGVDDVDDDGFGIGDVLQAVGNTGLVATIASISIRGAFLPSQDPSGNHGFAAQEIVKATIGGAKVPLSAGASNDGPLQFWAFPTLRLLEV